MDLKGGVELELAQHSWVLSMQQTWPKVEAETREEKPLSVWDSYETSYWKQHPALMVAVLKMQIRLCPDCPGKKIIPLTELNNITSFFNDNNTLH